MTLAVAGSALSVSILGGPVTFVREAGVPFQVAVIAGLSELGFTNESSEVVQDSFVDLPPFPADVGPSNAFGVDDLAIGFGIYLAAKLGDTLISEIGADIYGAKVRPVMARHWERLGRFLGSKTLVATFDHWFDDPGVLVRVDFQVSDSHSLAPDLELVEVALQNASLYIKTHGLTHRLLSYQVIDGRLSTVPTLEWPLPASPSE